MNKLSNRPKMLKHKPSALEYELPHEDCCSIGIRNFTRFSNTRGSTALFTNRGIYWMLGGQECRALQDYNIEIAMSSPIFANLWYRCRAWIILEEFQKALFEIN